MVIHMSPLRFGSAATDERVAVAEPEHDGWDDLLPPVIRFRVLAMAVVGPLITGYAAVAALLALITAVASRSHFSTAGVFAAAAPGWLAAHQVPVRIEGHVLGALPLLPTLVAAVLVGRTAAAAVHRLGLNTPRQAAVVIAAVAGGHALTGVLLALSCAAGPATVDPLAGFYYPALVAAAAATIGVARPTGLLELLRARMDGVALCGLRAGLLAVAALLTAGTLVVLLGLVTSLSTVRAMFEHNAPGVGSGLGLLLLSAGYLPNAVVAGVSFVAGSGFSMGTISLGPLHFTAGPVPGLPLLAALPDRAATWWALLLVVPVGIGVLIGRRLRDVADEPLARLRAAAVATGVVALAFVIMAGSAGGALGGGRYDPVDLHAAALSIALVAFVGVTAAAIAWFGGIRPEPDAPTDLLDDDPDPDTTNPDYPDSESTDPDYPAPDTTDPNYPHPDTTDPEHPALDGADPKYPDSDSADSVYPASGATDLNYSDSDTTDPKYPDPGSADPKYSSPDAPDPEYSALDGADPEYPVSDTTDSV